MSDAEGLPAEDERPALGDAETRVLLERWRRRRLRNNAAGLLGLSVLVTLTVVFHDSFGVFIALAGIPLYLAILSSRRHASVRAAERILREYPWRRYGYRLERQGEGFRATHRLVLLDPVTKRAIGSYTGVARYLFDAAGNPRGELVSFAGNPVYGGVLRLPDGAEFNVFKRVRIPRHTDTEEEAARARRARIARR
ncbi:hypothetical protein B4N89_25550 [Embleya scabrispora]|uniref:Uncharacterized protein n=1 Tax=Embleya scabrispora TaxID=159449 RepID=A0A1T3P4M0_9ACTN|nr:hypothetical protein [Embleya scabrispora]OPC83850.1 hypothetical protein B4N89_25550 [Embleya scabrispora]